MDIGGSLLELVENSMTHCKTGLPAGHVLSCTLTNFNLERFDSKFPENYTRYSDDMMFGVETMTGVHDTLRYVHNSLKECGFSLKSEKTKIINSPTLEKIS